MESENKNQWPSNSKFTFADQGVNKKNNSSMRFVSSDERPSNPNSAKSRKKPNPNIVYKGMPYEEWTKIRDQFLKNHNMF